MSRQFFGRNGIEEPVEEFNEQEEELKKKKIEQEGIQYVIQGIWEWDEEESLNNSCR
jgi:hypothetical protein